MQDVAVVTKIYIVRHGETHGNASGIVTGHFDSPLNVEGESQASILAEELRTIKFDMVFSSDLMRARRTAEIIALDRKLALNTTQLLRERNFGDWEGRPKEEVLQENQHLFEKLKTFSETEKRNFKFNQGYESEAQIYQRFMRFLREIAVAYLGKIVLVVCHGSMMRSLLMHLGFANYDELPPGSITNTGYFILESDGVDFFVKETKGVNKHNI
ncbi:MAG: histidine phosphatase family protein [Candidatus Doudnabacteria bacterium]|nr:histidine phosphatase family protein [Candidatus Doudnabacteria bacterium]